MSNLIDTNVRNDEATLNVDQAVRERYSAAASAAEPALCCPVQYDARYLKVLPRELIERGTVISIPQVGGLHHRYARAA